MKPSFFLGKEWFKCSRCGATWIEMLGLGQAIGQEIVKHSDGSKKRHFKAKLVRRKVKK